MATHSIHLPPGLRINRLIAGVLLLGSLSVLGVGAYLEPDTRGLGTHEQLGLGVCGFQRAMGLPCATCGYTTAVTYAAHGQILMAFVTQPAGALLALVAAMVAVLGSYCLVTGADLRPLGRKLWRGRVIWPVCGIILASWLYKLSLAYGVF